MGIAEKRIEELKGMKFNVPSYQRGYRWTMHEVTTLLEDLYNHDSKLKYCLQPLIVKKFLKTPMILLMDNRGWQLFLFSWNLCPQNLGVAVEEVINMSFLN